MILQLTTVTRVPTIPAPRLVLFILLPCVMVMFSNLVLEPVITVLVLSPSKIVSPVVEPINVTSLTLKVPPPSSVVLYTPAAKLIASLCNKLFVHPNVVNASDINEMTENMLYVEGSILDRFLEGQIGLEEVYTNKILLVS